MRKRTRQGARAAGRIDPAVSLTLPLDATARRACRLAKRRISGKAVLTVG